MAVGVNGDGRWIQPNWKAPFQPHVLSDAQRLSCSYGDIC